MDERRSPRRAGAAVAHGLLLSCALSSGVAAAAPASTIAAALRAPGPVLVIDAGDDRPHALLADKIADDLSALRGARPARSAAHDRDRIRADGANLVVLTSDAGDPWVTALAGGLDLRIRDDGLSFGGITLVGEDAAAAILLPREGAPDRWTLLLAGTGPAALRRLDGAIRSDVAAPLLAVDDRGTRLAELTKVAGRWSVPSGHPYLPHEVVERFETWRQASRGRVQRWDLSVTVAADAGSVDVEARVTVDRRRRGGPELWFQLNPRAELGDCRARGECLVHDARDGRLLVRVAAADGPVDLTYRLPLEGRIGAWYLGTDRGYLLPEANWVPRIRGGPDEPYLATAPHDIVLNAPGDPRHVGGDADGRRRVEDPRTPHLVWGAYRVLDAGGGRALFLAPGAPEPVEARALELLEVLAQEQSAASEPLRFLVAADRPAPWYGDGLFLVTPDLLEPGPLDELDRWILARIHTEAIVRAAPSPGKAIRVEGRVEPIPPSTTVRLWRLRGSWWQLEDEGPLGASGRFSLSARGQAHRMVSVHAPGQLPAALWIDDSSAGASQDLELEPVTGGSMVCFRCGPDQRAERFPLAPVEEGVLGVTLALGDLHRDYGTFPYAFELHGDSGRTVLVLDPRRPPDQFPSFLSPEEFHADTVVFRLSTGAARTWIETSGSLLLRRGWIEGTGPVSPPPAR